MGYGKTFEEFEPGAVYQHWPGRTITEHDNTWFALLSMNQNPLYVDAHYASRQPERQCPVIEGLIFSIVVGLTVADTSGKAIANLGYERVTFEKTVFPGDTLYAESTILEKRESKTKPDRGVVYLETRAFNQKRERVLTVRRNILVPKAEKA